MDAYWNIDVNSEILIVLRLVDLAGLWFDSKRCGKVKECCDKPRAGQSQRGNLKYSNMLKINIHLLSRLSSLIFEGYSGMIYRRVATAPPLFFSTSFSIIATGVFPSNTVMISELFSEE